jgi:hypothetical protein
MVLFFFILHTIDIHIIVHTYHSRFIPEGVTELSQIFLRDTHVLPMLLQSVSGVSAIPLVAFYDIYGGKREVLFF